jgi:hypothetical protein
LLICGALHFGSFSTMKGQFERHWHWYKHIFILLNLQLIV